MNNAERQGFLAALTRLEGSALRHYNIEDPEEREAVEAGLRAPWPKVDPDRKRHQPPPMKGDVA